jgi:hypothetical protein
MGGAVASPDDSRPEPADSTSAGDRFPRRVLAGVVSASVMDPQPSDGSPPDGVTLSHLGGSRRHDAPQRAAARSTSSSLTSHRRAAAAWSRALADGVFSLHFTKYRPVTPSTSGDELR